MSDEKLYTVKEVAKRLRVSISTVIRLIEEGQIKGVYRVGNQYRIPESSLEDYIRRSTL
jgi:excisionase family DNA binding protein